MKFVSFRSGQKKYILLCSVKNGGGGGQAKKMFHFGGRGVGVGVRVRQNWNMFHFIFSFCTFPWGEAKNTGFFLFRKNSERGGGLVQSKISLSEKNEIFLDFFLFKMDLGKRDMVNRGWSKIICIIQICRWFFVLNHS